MTIHNSQSFKYKAALVGKIANHNDGKSSVKDTKIVVPLQYLSNFWRSLEIPLINCKVYLELYWIEDCILSSAGDSAKFAITDAKLQKEKTFTNYLMHHFKGLEDYLILLMLLLQIIMLIKKQV